MMESNSWVSAAALLHPNKLTGAILAELLMLLFQGYVAVFGPHPGPFPRNWELPI